MYDKLHAIVLHTIKYSDKNSIVSLFTLEHGRMPFLLPQGGGKVARMRNALFMPLSILEIEAKIISGREISTFKEVRPAALLHTIHVDPVKNAISMFIAELIGKVIKANEESYALFRYLDSSIRLLDAMNEGVPNFHICFLYHLGSFLGVQPDMGSYREGYAFDMAEGVFVPFIKRSPLILSPDEAKVLKLFERISFSNIHLFRFNRQQRNEILETMLRYYKLHNSTLGTLKSPDILSLLFE